MKWKYYRVKGASKWVLGNNWVTKHDDSRLCILGINGERKDGLYIASPKRARKYIDDFYVNQGS